MNHGNDLIYMVHCRYMHLTFCLIIVHRYNILFLRLFINGPLYKNMRKKFPILILSITLILIYILNYQFKYNNISSLVSN